MTRYRPLPIGISVKVKNGATRLMKAWVKARDELASAPGDALLAFKEDSAKRLLVAYVAEHGLTGTMYDPRA